MRKYSQWLQRLRTFYAAKQIIPDTCCSSRLLNEYLNEFLLLQSFKIARKFCKMIFILMILMWHTFLWDWIDASNADTASSIYVVFCISYLILLILSLSDGPYGPMTNIVKDNFSGGKVENIVIVLIAVF